MEKLKAEIREKTKENLKALRRDDYIPAVLYGPNLENQLLKVKSKEFNEIFKKVGENILFRLLVDKNEYLVLIHDIQKDPLTDKVIHIDFFQPSLKEKIEVAVPLVFEGVAPAVKELGGTLVKDISEVEIRALPQELIHEIKVDISSLKTFDDRIRVKDLKVPKNIEILRDPEEIVALVVEPEKVEEELEKPIEEKIEEVEKLEKESEKVEEEEVEEKKEETETEKEKGTS